MATRTILTPGWASRTPITVAQTARAPMALAALRPLAISRLAAIDHMAIGHWRYTTSLARPWYQTARIDPWFGLSTHYAFRSRRRRDAEAEHAVSRRPVVQRSASIQTESTETVWPDWADEPLAQSDAPELFESLGDEPQAAIASTAGDFVPVSLPAAWTVAQSGAQARTASGRTVVARARLSRAVGDSPGELGTPNTARPIEATATPSEEPRTAEQPTAASSAAASAPMMTADERPVARRTPGSEPPALAAPAPGVAAPAQVRPTPPPWPFSVVTPAITYAAGGFTATVDAAPRSFAIAAPLVVRRVARPAAAQTTARQASPTLPPIGEEHPAPSAQTILEPITIARPVESMIAKVPPTELMLAAESNAAVRGTEPPSQPVIEQAAAAMPAHTVHRSVRRTTASAVQSGSLMANTTDAPARPVNAVSAQLARDWPVLAAVQRMLSPLTEAALPVESAAERVVRGLPAARRQAALAGVSDLPSMGGGTPIPIEVRRPMEILAGRELSGVRLYTSAVAAELGAEAFTTGERVVFAPGRLDLRSTRGLALVAHELAHVGQALAFREEGQPTATDAGEQTARQQEEQVTRIIEQGWPQAPRMEVLDAARALGRLAQSGGGPAGGQPPAGTGGAPAAQAGGGSAAAAQGPAAGGQASAAGGGAAPAGGGGGSDGASGSGGGSSGSAPGGAAPATNVDKIAQDVYELLKTRLRGELTRHSIY
ncbi:MAG: DUF4157 domain-containing protein [Chloroflexi bacterium]|nr:DUF4157 domain-containing protein [Chloroflexota bacterium]